MEYLNNESIEMYNTRLIKFTINLDQCKTKYETLERSIADSIDDFIKSCNLRNNEFIIARCNGCRECVFTTDELYNCFTNRETINETVEKYKKLMYCHLNMESKQTKGKLLNYQGIDLDYELNNKIVTHINNNIVNVARVGSYKYNYMRGNKKISGAFVDDQIMIDLTKNIDEFKKFKSLSTQHPELYDHILIIYKEQTGKLWFNMNTHNKYDPIFNQA